jgi:hypothetical protein
MMNAEIALSSHPTFGFSSETKVSDGSEATPMHAEELSDAVAAERLTERFAEMTWKTLLPITTLGLTFAVGVLACAQFFAVQI